MEDIKDLHNNLLVLINTLFEICASKNDKIGHYNENHKAGFSISNFLNTLGYENRLLKEQITLFINYISFFHISQKKQLKRLHMRMQDFYREVEENININQTFSINDISDEHKLEQFFVIGEEIQIEMLLEDTELLMESSDRILEKLENSELPEKGTNQDDETGDKDEEKSEENDAPVH
jgi:hypothetical protein